MEQEIEPMTPQIVGDPKHHQVLTEEKGTTAFNWLRPL